VQFGINKHEYIFQRLTKCGVFEKFTSSHLFQIAQEKSHDYLLIIYTNEKISRCLSSRNAHVSVSRNQEKLRHQLRHPGHVLDFKAKDLIGHL